MDRIPRKPALPSLLIPFLLCCLVLPLPLAQGEEVIAVKSTFPLKRNKLALTLGESIALALRREGNARVGLARENVRQAHARSAQARSQLIPNLDGSVSQQTRTTNLEALGIQIDVAIPGFRRPSFVGPFNTFDARAAANQRLLDLGAIRSFQGARAGIKEANAEDESIKDQVAALVATAYVSALRAEARLGAARANAELAQALLDLADNQKRAGTGTRIEVTRAQVQLANQSQELLVAENDRRRTHLQLLHAIGLPLQVELDLAEELAYFPMTDQSVEEALRTALMRRSDLEAQNRRAARLRLQHSAVKWERLPSLHGFADYGALGTSVNSALPTRTLGFSVLIPVFDGGRRDARRTEVLSQLRQEQIRTVDLRRQIELEVQLAFDGLRSANQQVLVAERGLQLAAQELEQAQRRYGSGVATSLEVTDAQTRLERARENRIMALFHYNLARIELGQAMGVIRDMF